MVISSSRSLFSSTDCMLLSRPPRSVVCMWAVEGLIFPCRLALLTNVVPTLPTAPDGFLALPLCLPMLAGQASS
jgi:hypothetical protein